MYTVADDVKMAVDQTGRESRDVDKALSELGCSLRELRHTRERIGETGTVIWELIG
jgi:hypothetical protein